MFLSESIWTILWRQSHFGKTGFRENMLYSVRRSEKVLVLMLNYTVFTLGSNWAENPIHFFGILNMHVKSVYYIFNYVFGKHILGLCWSANVCFQIRPQEMSEGCFWVRANEDQYAKPELLTRVAVTFCMQRTGEPPLLTLHCCNDLNLEHK